MSESFHNKKQIRSEENGEKKKTKQEKHLEMQRSAVVSACLIYQMVHLSVPHL